MKHCNVEHYVVNPDTPVYDWTYEHSTSSDNNDLERLSTSINNLLKTLAQMQNTISGTSSTGISSEQLTTMVNSVVNQYLDVANNTNRIVLLIDNRLKEDFGVTSTSDLSLLRSEVSTIKSQINSLQPIINNIENFTELSQIDPEDITSIQNQLTSLSNTVNGLVGNIDNTVNQAINTALQNNTTLNEKIEQLVETAVSNSSAEYQFKVEDKTLSLEKVTA